MSVRVRLTRVGSKKNPIWRLVVSDQRSPRDGRFIEVVGHYDPLTDPPTIKVEAERARHWLSVGAKPSPTVEGLLKRAGVIDASATYNKPKGQRPAADAEATA